MWLFLAFLAVPLIEIALFIQVGGLIGLGWTLLIVIVTAILGTYLVRQQGMRALGEVKSSFNEIRDPSEPLAHGAMILFAGALLLTPGFFTDAVGFLLLVPAVRHEAFKALRARIKVQHFDTGPRHDPRRDPRGDVIDAEYHEIDIETSGRKGSSGWTKDEPGH